MRVIRSFAVARVSKTNFFDALFSLRFSNFETTLSNHPKNPYPILTLYSPYISSVSG